MATTIVRIKAESYEGWRKAWDAGRESRKVSGQTAAHVHRDASDPSTVVVVARWPSLDSARAFFQKQREMIAASGRPGAPPEVSFLDDVETESY